MNKPTNKVRCPECGELVDRRSFLKEVTAATLALGCATHLPAAKGTTQTKETQQAETLVKQLYKSLTAEQRSIVVLPWDDPRRRRVSPNWEIVDLPIKELFNEQQQALIREIVRSVTSEDGFERFMKQMQDDWGGLSRYTCAIFGDPESGPFEWELAGRHVTLRCDGNAVEGTAFGGPLVYGHAPEFNEKPGHPGNVFWYQAVRANQVFLALDGKQRQKALLDQPPQETDVAIRPADAPRPGICVGELSPDQRELVLQVIRDILLPYRQSDQQEALGMIEAGGGISKLYMAFYKQGDIGNDGVWDIWRIEGPTAVFHFRGSPHIHAYINVATKDVLSAS
jgi:hypothetical protein